MLQMTENIKISFKFIFAVSKTSSMITNVTVKVEVVRFSFSIFLAKRPARFGRLISITRPGI